MHLRSLNMQVGTLIFYNNLGAEQKYIVAW